MYTLIGVVVFFALIIFIGWAAGEIDTEDYNHNDHYD